MGLIARSTTVPADGAEVGRPSARGAWIRARAGLANPLDRNAFALMASTAASAALGLLFWTFAAHRFDTRSVGENSALISAMQTLSTVAQLDMAWALIRFVPRFRAGVGHAIRLAYAVTAIVAVAAGVLFVTMAPRIDANLLFLRDRAVSAVFAGGLVIWGVFAIEDGALTGLGRATVVPLENAGYGALKLLLLLVFASFMPHWGIFVSWNLSLVPAVIIVNLLIFRRYVPRHRERPPIASEMTRAAIVRYLAFDYGSGLAGAATSMVIPLLVLSVLGPVANGHFYIAWMFASLLDAISLSFASSLIVEASPAPERLAVLGRRAMRKTFVLLALAVVTLEIFAPDILGLFGHTYSSSSSNVMRILLIGVLGRGVINFFVATGRVQGRSDRVMYVTVTWAIVLLGLAVVLGRMWGLNGIAFGWTAANLAVAFGVSGSLATSLRAARHLRKLHRSPMTS